ncbi:hypothetical protein ACQV2X_05605 [Facklamia sp. P12945]|uniref:hypothetical protein n=1 Tax=Facklamia sp. P12945 TaxID=3421950 RepID=UPI003D1740D5
MASILKIRDLNRGDIIRQDDKTTLKYQLYDPDDDLNLTGKSANIYIMRPNMIDQVYKTSTTVLANNIVNFTIGAFPAGKYVIEIIVDGKFKFPSCDKDIDAQLTVTRSATVGDVNVIIAYGKDQLIAEVVPKVEKASAEEVANIVKPSVIPTVGSNGTWVVDGKSTGVEARGPIGPRGPQGPQGPVYDDTQLKQDIQRDYLTKQQAQFGYQPKGEYLTKAETDSHYQPLGEYLTNETFISDRNLLIDSEKITRIGVERIVNDQKYYDYGYNWHFSFPVEAIKGETYTLSVPVHNSNQVALNARFAGVTVNNDENSNKFMIILPNETKVMKYTFTRKATVRNHVIKILTEGNSGNYALSFGLPKMQRGSIATDWTPAPEDMVSKSGKDFKQARVIHNLARNGNFDQGTSHWGSELGNISIVDGKIKLQSNGQYVITRLIQNNTQSVLNNKIYIYLNSNRTNTRSINIEFYDSTGKSEKDLLDNSVILDFPSTTGKARFTITSNFNVSSSSNFTEFDNIIIVDLTKEFGAGNEPTKEEMDTYIENGVIDWLNDEVKIDYDVTIWDKIRKFDELSDLSIITKETIGGTNLFRNSNREVTLSSFTISLPMSQEFKDKLSGEIVSVSFDAKMDEFLEGDYVPHIYYRTNSGARIPFVYEKNGKRFTDKWQRFHFTIPKVDDVALYDTLTIRKVKPEGNATIKNIKVEIGRISSDWSPSPEDVFEEIEKIKQAIRGLGVSI